LSNYGVTIVHNPTVPHPDVNISKFERHFYAREYLKTLEDTDIVLLTDTLDVVFQADPFEWYRENKTNKLLLTSEGIDHVNEHWNMRGMINSFPYIKDEISFEDVFNSGLIAGEVKYVKDLLLLIYILASKAKPEHSEGVDQPSMNALLITNLIKENIQSTTTTESFAVNCAVAGPTEQFISWGFDKNYKYDLPTFSDNGVVNKNGELYCIVHQYNRVPEWNEYFISKYQSVILPKKNISLTNASTAIVVCARTNSSYFGDWRSSLKFNNDDYLLCDTSAGDLMPFEFISDFIPDNIINYNINNIRATFDFKTHPDKRHWWSGQGNRNIIWFYPHLRMLYFYKTHPNYDYYWFFDEDVTFPNNQLYDFVNSHKQLDSDCMITYLFSDLNNTNPSQVPVIDENMVSFHSDSHYWLTHYPGPGDLQDPGVIEKYGSYFPLVRYSNKAMSTLLEAHENGYYGYSEGYVPTMLNHYGLSLYSIYNKDSKVTINEDITVYHRRYLELQWTNL
jgi:hypothetical protein